MKPLISLVDCNSFYASCEKVFRPDLRDKPVIVLSNNDGCVVARSSEAKALGIEMGVPAFEIEAVIKRHRVTVFSSNYTLYGDMSNRVMTVLDQYSPEVENYSIDESFLTIPNNEEPVAWATSLKSTVKKWTGIPVSVGVAPTKTLAKLANRLAKKSENGVRLLVDAAGIRDALAQTLASDVWGIGPASTRKLLNAGIATAEQLVDANDRWLLKQLSIVGLKLVQELRGDPCLDLELIRPRKQEICVSRSFGQMVETMEEMQQAVATHTARLGEKLRSQQSLASTLHVFFHTNRFRSDDPQCSRSGIVKLPVPTSATNELIFFATRLVERLWQPGFRLKKCGVVAIELVDAGQRQGNLFYRPDTERDDRISATVDRINHRLGARSIRFAAEGITPDWEAKFSRLSPRYTTRWPDIPEAS